jgi:cytidine deaminase
MSQHGAEAAEAALAAYAPYSRFRVGAVAVASDGRWWSGCNVENAAYGSTICAEANALSSAVASGYRGPLEVFVACIDADRVADATPCGNCRQIMAELEVTHVTVTIDGTESRRFTLDELMPHRFDLP